MFPQLKTKRTSLVELTENYIDDLYEIFSDNQVTQYMDIDPMTSIDETREVWIQWAKEVYEDNTGIRWGIFFDNRIVGTCGFHNIKTENNIKSGEIGYDLMVKYWGKGLVSEVIPIIIKFAFEVLKLNEIHACIIPENIKSKNVISKFGFKYKKVVDDEELYSNVKSL